MTVERIGREEKGTATFYVMCRTCGRIKMGEGMKRGSDKRVHTNRS